METSGRIAARVALGVIAPLLLSAIPALTHAESTLDKVRNVVDALQIRNISGDYTYTARGIAGSGVAKVEQSGRDVRILTTWLSVRGGPHYEFRGKVSGNTIDGQWYSHYHKKGWYRWGAQISPDGSIDFANSDDPIRSNIRLTVMRKQPTQNVFGAPPIASSRPGTAPSSTDPSSSGTEVAGVASMPGAGVIAPTVVNIDIVGIKLGMTLDEVKRAVQAHSPAMQISEHNGIINNQPATAYMSWLIARAAQGAPAGSSDAIGVHFAPPPNAHRALFIERFTGFLPNQQPLYDAIKEALIQKFGRPSAIREDHTNADILWTFNAGGAQLIEKSTVRCGRFPPTDPPARGQNILFSGNQSQGCGVTVYARIGRATMNSPLTHYLSVSLIDDSSFEEIRQAAARYANQATRESASKVGVPKL